MIRKKGKRRREGRREDRGNKVLRLPGLGMAILGLEE